MCDFYKAHHFGSCFLLNSAIYTLFTGTGIAELLSGPGFINWIFYLLLENQRAENLR